MRRFTGSVSPWTTPPSIRTSPRSGARRQSGDHRNRRRLACSVRPEQSDHVPGSGSEGYLFYRN
jgi:hypothetical protein